MIAALKAEFRKLFSVRATYFCLFAIVILEGLFAFYGDGIRAEKANLVVHTYLANEVSNAIPVVALFIGIAGVLLVGNEYRHNTIFYTLTASNSRTRIITAKLLLMAKFSIVFSVLLGFLSPALVVLGLHAGGHHYVSQTFPIWPLLWRAAYYGLGFTMFGMAMAFIIRNQIGTIVTYLVLPGFIEPLLGHLFQTWQKFLPFDLLNQVANTPGTPTQYGISSPRAAGLYLIYMAVLLIFSYALFLKRDAN